MIQTKETRPGTAGTVQDARKEVHNTTSDSTPFEASSQALAVEKIIRCLREREIAGEGFWPGDAPEPPVTLYPNLAAEILAEPCCLWCPAERAGITEVLLADALEAGAELRADELARLANFFGCRLPYLLAPTLQVVDPRSRKGWLRAVEVCGAVDAFRADFGPGESLPDSLYRNQVKRAEYTAWRFAQGQPVTYAEYRLALGNLQYVRRRLSTPKPRGREARDHK